MRNLWYLSAAVALVTWRDIKSLGSIQANNFFFFVLLVPASIGFLGTLVLLLMILPALGAPLAKLPGIRLQLWPIEPQVENTLRPLAQRAAPSRSSSSPNWWQSLPSLELRLLVRTLDLWLAVLIAAAGTAWCALSPTSPPEARAPLAMLVVLALSTLSQSLFGLEGESGRTRRKLGSERGFWILARKGGLLLILSISLCALLAPLAALSGMLASLAIGHYASVLGAVDSTPWRFSVGRFVPHGFFQVIAMFSCGIATARGEYVFLFLSAAAYVLSLLLLAWIWERF